MKSFLSFLLLAALAAGLIAAPAAVYQCPMHPWIKSDKAGDKCTICGMALVAPAAGSAAADADPNLVTLTAASATVVGVRTTETMRGSLIRTLRVSGVVEDDDTRHRILAARVPGRVEKLGVNFVGAEIEEGTPLATIYSPEMLTAQRQYVERFKAGSIAFSLADRSSARERLLELGLTAEEINILEHTLEPVAMVNVRAPMSGTVVSRAAYEGQYVQTNDRLFEIGDFSSMWFVFDAYEPDLAWLRVGQLVDVSVPSRPGQIFTAPIAFIDPNLNEQSRTAKVRVVLPNPNRTFLHKQTGLARVRLEVADVLLAPRTAVLQHGAEPVVFVEQSNRAYLARRVRLGRVGDDTVEILDGLKSGDRVVSEGGLILDGQAQLARAAITGELTVAGATVAGGVAPGPVATSDQGYPELKALAFATADAAVPLAADDLATYQQKLPAVRVALKAYLGTSSGAAQSPLGKLKDPLPERTDLRSARRDFEPFSTALADLALTLHLAHREGLHVFQCPMSPVLGTGRWLSRSAEVKNPFFGSAMPECGDELN